MNRCGYLSRTGKFFDCMAYGHLELAKKICERVYNKTFATTVEAESFLLDNGWVMFQEYTVAFRFKLEDKYQFLSPDQKYFMMDELDVCDDDLKLAAIESTLTRNDILNNTRL